VAAQAGVGTSCCNGAMARRSENLAAPDGRPASLDAEARPERTSGLKASLEQRLRGLPANHASSPAYARADSRGADARDRDTSAWDLEPSFRAQVPGFERLRDQHLARWPERDKPADRRRPDDPAGSWRGDGGRYLSPEQNAEAARLIAGLREHEGAITAKRREIEKDSPHGGVLVGLSHRLKGDNRLKEKIADRLNAQPGSSMAEAVAGIWDAVRFTFRFDRDVYPAGYRGIEEQLNRAGYRMRASENRWLEDPEYKGVNTKWSTSGGGRFELQFHTPESHYAKEHLTHMSYERIRARGTTWEERSAWQAYQRLLSAAIPVPAGVERI